MTDLPIDEKFLSISGYFKYQLDHSLVHIQIFTLFVLSDICVHCFFRNYNLKLWDVYQRSILVGSNL